MRTWSSGEGRKKSSSKPMLTSMMTTSKSANKRDYDNKGAHDNLREGNRNISSSTSTLITAAACARTTVLAKSTSSSWRGRKKSLSTPTSTSMMATPNSANKWDYNNEGTYDNLQIAVAHHLIDLWNGSEFCRTNKTSNDGYCKDTALNEANYSPKKRCPLRGKSNESLVNKAGFVTIEAVNILTNHLAIKEETLHFGSTLGFYPDAYTGLKNCHLRALHAASLRAAKLALSSKVKHNNSLKIH
jgi:hypothetical protein